ncbi:MAG: hypothetical protein AAB091_03095, partial [Elusimicrobiota bacterium]
MNIKMRMALGIAVLFIRTNSYAESRWITVSSKMVDIGSGAIHLQLEHEDIESKGGDSCVLIRLRQVEDISMVFWNGCLWHEPIAYPRPLISGDFATDTKTGRIFIAVGTSYTFDLDLRLFVAKSDRTTTIRVARDKKGGVGNARELNKNYKDPF